jgi:hypothetical protein
MPNESYQNTLHLVNAHVHMLNHGPVEHSRRHIPPPAFLLQGIEALEHDPFPAGKTVFHIREIVTRITGRHMKVSPRRAYPEFRCDALRWYMEKFSHVLLAYFRRLPFNVLSNSLSNQVYTCHIQSFLLISPLD